MMGTPGPQPSEVLLKDYLSVQKKPEMENLGIEDKKFHTLQQKWN